MTVLSLGHTSGNRKEGCERHSCDRTNRIWRRVFQGLQNVTVGRPWPDGTSGSWRDLVGKNHLWKYWIGGMCTWNVTSQRIVGNKQHWSHIRGRHVILGDGYGTLYSEQEKVISINSDAFLSNTSNDTIWTDTLSTYWAIKREEVDKADRGQRGSILTIPTPKARLSSGIGSLNNFH